MNHHAVELYEGLMTTRSMHRFTSEPVADLHCRAHQRYEAALVARAPARQGEDQASFERAVAAPRHQAEHLGDVPVLIAVTTDAASKALADAEGVMDVGTPAAVFLAVGNLLLAARSRGLGTSLTSEPRIHHDEVR